MKRILLNCFPLRNFTKESLEIIEKQFWKFPFDEILCEIVALIKKIKVLEFSEIS